MITAVAATTVPVAVDILEGKQPTNGLLKIRFGAAASLDQRDTGRRMRNKDMTQPVTAITTELPDLLSEISNKTRTGTHSQHIAIHY